MDYRRNEDKWPVREMPAYNAVLGVAFEETGPEPVSLEEVKAHLHITYNDDDVYLSGLISSCRAAIEKYTALSLIQKTVTATLNNGVGGIELPYGPVVSITSLKNENDEVIQAADYTIEGGAFKTVKLPAYDLLTVTYEAGYETIPADIKMAILFEIEYYTKVRAGETANNDLARKLAAPHRRITWL